MNNIGYWRRLEEDFLGFLKAKGYTYEAIKHYRCTTTLLVRYANANRCEAYTPEIGIEFLESEERLMYLQPASYRYQRTIIRRLNEYLDGEKYSPSYLRVNYECPEPFKEAYDKYLVALRNSGVKYNTEKQYRVLLAKLFQDIVSQGITTWDMVDAKAIAGAFSRSTAKAKFAHCTQRMFKFLVSEKIVNYNYSGIIPKIQYWNRIPSVYNKDEISAILDSVNRSTDIGKRDYAMLLLAARLGLRSSDIRLLRFDEVDFKRKLIEFVQFKTGVPQRLTLLPEVEEALLDYIDNARGDSTEPYIFLTSRKSVRIPVSANAICNAVAKYFRESGVKFGDRHHGTHALRMSLASALVAENVPYDVVRAILGHESPDSITHYVKLDVDNLRSCALDVPVPTGRFAEYLAYGKESFSCE